MSVGLGMGLLWGVCGVFIGLGMGLLWGVYRAGYGAAMGCMWGVYRAGMWVLLWEPCGASVGQRCGSHYGTAMGPL